MTSQSDDLSQIRERRRKILTASAELAVFEYGRDAGPKTPSMLLVHGYPDDHRVFLPVIRELAATHHLIAYDTRNAGESKALGDPGDYTLPALVDDLFAVLDAIDVGSVHLVGHDWGSIQGWRAVRDPRVHGKITGFTSVSGPDLGHFSHWMRRRLAAPRKWPQLGGQLLRSWYVAAFQLPIVPEAVWRLWLTGRYEAMTGRRVGTDPVRGLALYRANMFSGKIPQAPLGQVPVPVHVVVPVKDPFLSPALVEGVEQLAPTVRVTEVAAGHWWPASHPREFARILRG